MVWHYHDDVRGSDADIRFKLENLPLKSGKLRMRQYRIDADYSNACTAWQKMNSPQNPSPPQRVELEKAGQLAEMKSAERNRRENF